MGGISYIKHQTAMSKKGSNLIVIFKRAHSTAERKQSGRISNNFVSTDIENIPSRVSGIQCPMSRSVSQVAQAVEVTRPELRPLPFKMIPSPKGLPIVGTLFDYLKKDGLKFNKMFEVQRQRALQLGNIYLERYGPVHSVVVSCPSEYNRLVHSEGKYPIRREMVPIAYYRRLRGYDLGIVNSHGEEWYKIRSIVSKKMLKLPEVLRFSGEMGQVADDFITRLDSVRGSRGEVPGLEHELFKWTMESICTYLFEERIGCLGESATPIARSFLENLEGFFKTLQPLLYNVPLYQVWPTKTWLKFQNYADNIMDIGHFFVEKTMKESTSDSAFISYLANECRLSMKEITGLVVDLLSAAVETTSAATVWCLYNLAKNPHVQESILREINMIKGENRGTITAAEMSRLPLIRAVVKETLRLYPITFATSRILTDDIVLCGYNIPAGTHVQANLYGMYHNSNLFPQAESFLPDRWLRENAVQMDPIVKSTSQLVWGHGARMCIGRRIAEQEIHIVLGKIIERFHLSYHHPDVEPVLSTMMIPDKPMRIQFTPRRKDN
ncbi:Peptidyl-prolyl cis-trans isomerase cyp10 [Bulinus truncatus]|nr:Peptidyl-prolyl cis-trans isomerase cyp10 [Bulinus truncatus]